MLWTSQYEAIFGDWRITLLDTVYVLSKNSLQSQYPSPSSTLHHHHHLHLPLLASFSVSKISNGSQYPGGGDGAAGLLLKSSPLLPECGTAAFQNPAAPAHSSWRAKKKKKKKKKKKWLFIRILVLYCSEPHKRRFIMLEASPLSQRETITWNCLF